MGTVRLEGRLSKSRDKVIIQKVETIRNPDGSVEHMLSCYKPNNECKDRKIYQVGGIEITKYCPFSECRRKN